MPRKDKRRRRRRREPKDPAWRPGRSRQRTGGGDALRMRADTSNVEKMSAMFDASAVTRAMHSPLAKSLREITPHRPVAKIVTRSSAGSPLVVATPGGTKLARATTYGAIHVFSSEQASPYKPPKSTTKPSEDFYESDAYKAIRTINETIKVQELEVKPTKLKQVHKQFTKQGWRRLTSQNKAMTSSDGKSADASAKKYVRASTLFSGDAKWEWLHLIGYMIGGEQTQTAENLVAGRHEANTDMMFIEGEIPFLATEYPNGFQLKVIAHLIEGTHIATKINYHIETPDFTIRFTFNPQSKTKPHIRFRDYIHRYVETLVRTKKRKEQTPRRSKRIREKLKGQLFFDRSEGKENKNPSASKKPKPK